MLKQPHTYNSLAKSSNGLNSECIQCVDQFKELNSSILLDSISKFILSNYSIWDYYVEFKCLNPKTSFKVQVALMTIIMVEAQRDYFRPLFKLEI